jgi:hypothetical protein
VRHNDDCEAIVSFGADRLDLRRNYARFRGKGRIEATHPLDRGILAIRVDPAPLRTMLSATMRLPERESLTAHSKYSR